MATIQQKSPIDLLLSYQVPHVYQLYESLQKSNCVLDASDTGTGKTYTTTALCSQLKLKPFIICPKSVINNWIEVSKKMNVEILGVANYEKLKGCKYYTSTFEIAECPYIDKIKKEPIKKLSKTSSSTSSSSEGIKKKKNEDDFVFQLPIDTIIIIDEAHRCKNHKTVNSKMLMAMRDSERKIVLLSATITDKIDCFRPFGVVFGFYDNPKKFKLWLRNKLANKKKLVNDLKWGKENLSDQDIALKIIHDSIFPDHGSRLKIKELGDLFPSNQVVAKCYYSDDHEKVNELYNMINKALDDLKDKEKRSSALGEIVRCRMRIEMFKLPIVLDLIDDALENNYSVAVFVNYKDSMEYLCHHLKENCSLIHGDQTLDDRQYNIDSFQKNENKVIISIIQAGGVGISLHDLHGRPRMSIISPSWSGTDVVQALGRIHRAGSKSPALQRLVYIAKSYEEEICKKLGEKLSVLSGINDGDLVGPKITKEKLKEIGELETVNKNVINVDDTIEQSNDEKIKKVKSVKTVKKKKFVVVENDESDDVGNFIEKDKNKDNLKVNSSKPFAKLSTKYKLKK